MNDLVLICLLEKALSQIRTESHSGEYVEYLLF